MGNDKPTPPRPTKKRSGINLLRAALLVIRRRSRKTQVQLDVAKAGKKGLFRSLLSAMRPLNQPKLEDGPPAVTPPDSPRVREKEVFLPPPSPCGSEGWFSTDGMSRYASAEDLRSLDPCSDVDGYKDEIEEEADEARDGTPNSIDLKAEEFIAMFYAQMRLQRMGSVGFRT